MTSRFEGKNPSTTVVVYLVIKDDSITAMTPNMGDVPLSNITPDAALLLFDLEDLRDDSNYKISGGLAEHMLKILRKRAPKFEWRVLEFEGLPD